MSVLVRFVLALLHVVLLPLRALRRARAAPKGAWLSLELEGELDDVTSPRPFWQRWRKASSSLHGLTRAIDEVVADDAVRGLVVTAKSIKAGWASALGLREQLVRLREAGREVVVHLPMGAATKDLFVASIGSKILLGPRTSLSPIGFAVTARYVRGLFERVSVQPEVYAQGRFKSAGETLTLPAMTEPQRLQTNALLDELYASFLANVAAGRGRLPEEVVRWIDGAPYAAEDAKTLGIIDGVAYDDEVRSHLGAVEKDVRVVPLGAYVAARRAPRWRPILRPPVVGVVPVHGSIVGRRGPGFGVSADEESVIGAVRLARRSKRVKAVVLHVNSPGGSALASDRMHHELVQLAREKPLVACFANVAASGGYYVGCAAHVIVAQPVTVTGSIGVVAIRFALDALLERLGIHSETLKRGAHADLLDPTRALDPDERALVDREMRVIYEGFVDVVAAGRKRPREEIFELAEGRVYSGREAHAKGLVDVLGGFDVALKEARQRAGDSTLEPIVLASRSGGPPLPRPAAPGALLEALGIPTLTLDVLLGGERVLALCTDACALQ